MELKLGATVSYFLWSLALGGFLAGLYDLLRTERRIFKRSVFGVNFEDICFFLVAGVLFFWTAYDKNNGQMRWQGFLGAFFGFVLYRKIFKDYWVRLLVWFYDTLTCIAFRILKIVLFPVQVVYKILAKPFLVVAWYTRKGAKRAEGVLRSGRKRREIRKKCRRAQRMKSRQEKRAFRAQKRERENQNFR